MRAAMKKPVVLLVNGPNLDMLGRRDPAQYGTFTLADVEKAFAAKCAELGVEPRFFQSGCEGELCRAIHEAMGYAAGIVINAGAYTHYSYALLDALLLAKVPAMEVHISDIRVQADEMRDALWEAGHFIASQNLRKPIYDARDVLNLKTTFGL